MSAKCFEHPVNSVARKPKDGIDSPVDETVNQQIGNFFGHQSSRQLVLAVAQECASLATFALSLQVLHTAISLYMCR